MPERLYLLSHFDFHKIDVYFKVFQRSFTEIFEFIEQKFNTFDMGSVIFVIEGEKTFEGC